MQGNSSGLFTYDELLTSGLDVARSIVEKQEKPEGSGVFETEENVKKQKVVGCAIRFDLASFCSPLLAFCDGLDEHKVAE